MGRNFDILGFKRVQELKWKALIGPNSRLKMSEERLVSLRTGQLNFQSEEQREIIEEKWPKHHTTVGQNKYANMCVIGVPGRGSRKREENYFKK